MKSDLMIVVSAMFVRVNDLNNYILFLYLNPLVQLLRRETYIGIR